MPATDTPAVNAVPKQLTIKLPITASLFDTLDQKSLEAELGRLAWQAGQDLIGREERDELELVPEQIAEETGLIEYAFVDTVIVPELPIAEGGGWLCHRVRGVLRKLGMLSPAPMGRNLAETKEVAIRLKTADGQAVTVTIPESVLDDPGDDLWAWITSRAKAAM